MLAPDGAGPGGVAREASDDVDMKLRNHVAQGGNIHLVRARACFQGGTDSRNFLPEELLVFRFKAVDLANASAARYQYHPRVLPVVHAQQFAKLEAAHSCGVRLQLRVQLETCRFA